MPKIPLVENNVVGTTVGWRRAGSGPHPACTSFSTSRSRRAMAIEREKALDARCNDYDTNPIELQPPLVRLVTPLTAAGH